MKIVFTGTSAADFSPLLSAEFKDSFDKDVRRSSGLLIDGHVQIDCGPHTVGALEILNIPLSDITDLLITHLHDDHFLPDEIEKIASVRRDRQLRVWCHEDAISEILLPGCEIIPLHPLTPVNIRKMKLIPLNANHQKHPLHFFIEKDGKRLFYGCDGAWLLNDTFYFLKDKQLDTVIFDGTVGDYTGDYRMSEHNSLPMIKLMLPSLKTVKAVTEKTKIFISHLAPSLHKSHRETINLLKNTGIDVAFDGLEYNI